MRFDRLFTGVFGGFVLAVCTPLVIAENAPQPKAHKVAVEIDVTQAPEMGEWAKKAKELIQEWYPRVANLLESDGFTPPTKIRLVFKNDMGLRIPGMASGNTISISSEYIAKYPNDLGMVIHEMTHVIQAYPRSPVPSGWLIEGIADYIRFYHYEPGPAIGQFNPNKANYTDGYRTTARFLAWIEKNHDKSIIKTLNKSLRQGKYDPDIFKRETTKSLDELWHDFVADSINNKTEKKPKGNA